MLAAQRCEKEIGKRIASVPAKDVQADGIWYFVGSKQKALQAGDDPNFGDAYTLVAIERSTKLVLNLALGKPDRLTTNVCVCIEGLRRATSPQPFQLTADGFPTCFVSLLSGYNSNRIS